MNIFFEPHQKLLKDLLTENVDFMLIGGYAVNFHGYNRTTGDMDVWIKPDNQNKSKLINALRKNGIAEESLHQMAQLDFTEVKAFSVWDNPYKTDFLTKISGVTYDQADAEKIIADIDGIKIPIINLNHLVLSKFATGRLQDKTDIEKLQEINKKKKGT